MADDLSLDKLVSGGYARAGEQNAADIVGLFRGETTTPLLERQAYRGKLTAEIQSQNASIAAQQRLTEIMRNPPTNPDGGLDYNALADMMVFSDPKGAIEMRKEARAERTAQVNEADKKIQQAITVKTAVADELATVTDQAGLDQFIADAKELNMNLPQNFPTIYNDTTKGAIGKLANQLRGEAASIKAKLTQAQIANQESLAREHVAAASDKEAHAGLERERTDRLRHGLPENVPARESGADALAKSDAIAAARAPTAEEEKLLEGRLIPRLAAQMGLKAGDFDTILDSGGKPTPKNPAARAKLQQLAAEVHAQTYQNLIDQHDKGETRDVVKAQRAAVNAALKNVKEKYKTTKGGWRGDTTTLDVSGVTDDDRKALLADPSDQGLRDAIDEKYGEGAADAIEKSAGSGEDGGA